MATYSPFPGPVTDFNVSCKAPIQDFLIWTKKYSLQSSQNGARFLPFCDLQAYFTKPRLKLILDVIFLGSDCPPLPDNICGYLRNFAILLTIGKGEFIEHFIRYDGLSDSAAPFRSTDPPDGFPISTSDAGFYSRFRNEQWFFYPQLFRLRDDLMIDGNIILPFINKDEIAKGGSARVYRITIHDSYNDLCGPGEPRPKFFVLKTFYTFDANVYYRRELNAFQRLKNTENVIRYCGSFQYEKELHLLLEYANGGNLANYFEKEPQPMAPREILNFWRNFLKIASGVESIHNTIPSTLERKCITLGWHQDIKPANILVVKPGAGPYEHQFKVGDLGLCHFKIGRNEDLILDGDSYGTRTYGAPETYKWDTSNDAVARRITNKVDVWSLCAIFSEAAVWVALDGYNGVKRYRDNRLSETSKVDGFKKCNCFHDGSRVLNSVKRMHVQCKERCRKGDNITPSVIDLIDEVFEQSPEQRFNAQQFCYRIKKMVENAAVSLADDGTMAEFQNRLNNANVPITYHQPHQPYQPHRTVSLPPRQLPPELPPELSRQGTAPPSIGMDRPIGSSSRASGVGAHHSNGDHYGHLRNSRIAPISIAEETPERYQERPIDPQEDFTSIGGRRPKRGSSSWARGTELQPIPIAGKDKGVQRCPSVSTVLELENILTADQSSHSVSHEYKLPELSRLEGEKWMKEKKKPSRVTRWVHSKSSEFKVSKWISSGSSKVNLPNDHLLKRLHERDHVFVFDDSEAMAPEWGNVASLFRLLAYMVKGTDDDGLDIVFAADPQGRITSSSSRKLHDHVLKNIPQGPSNLKNCLDNLLEEHGENLMQKKRLSMYVFTNGDWQGPGQACGIDDPIRRLVKKIVSLEKGDSRVAIQFIRFGNSPQGAERLVYLDNNLGTDIDIVDTTHCEGNIWKILLGATDRAIDNEGEHGHLHQQRFFQDNTLSYSPRTSLNI